MIDSQSITDHAFASCVSMSFSVDELETLLLIGIYIQDIGMESCVQKCAMEIMAREKKTEGIGQANEERIRTLGEKENYKY